MPYKVLIVDDQAMMHELIKVHLADEPWEMLSAYDGPAALASAGEALPDVILLDVDMPDMNGFDVCRLLKKNAATASIPVIFLTAAASADDKIRGLDLRAVDYVTKPFDPGELCARIRAAFRTKRLLELLPISAAEPVAREASRPGINARLSMKEMLQARRMNPWERQPPSRSTALATEAVG